MTGATEQILFCVALMLVAMAYAAVGQGGATGYIAVMGLVGFGPDVIRPAALTLNVLVSAIGTAQFARAELLKWGGFIPSPCWAYRALSLVASRICLRSFIIPLSAPCYCCGLANGSIRTPDGRATTKQ